jgi:hypothetical protein
MFIDRALVFDHLARTVVLRHLSAAEGVEEWANDTRTRLLGLEPGEPDEPEPMTVSGARWRHDSTAYLALIGRCQDAIRMGDAYLLCLTNQITLDPIADVVDANRRLRRTNPSHPGRLNDRRAEAQRDVNPHHRVHTRPRHDRNRRRDHSALGTGRGTGRDPPEGGAAAPRDRRRDPPT